MEFKTKYFGILQNFNFEDVNKKTFEKLVQSGIFDEYELTNPDINEDFFISDSDTMLFGDSFIQNRKEYHLKKDILLEMIYVKNWELEAFYDVDHLIEEIETKFVSEFHLENKLKILEENYKKYFNQIKDKTYYSLFKNKISTGGHESWEEYFISHIIDDGNYLTIAKFLNGNHKYLNDEIINQWNEYFVFSKISDYCEEKKNTLLNIKPNDMDSHKIITKEDIHLSIQIFVLEEIRSMDKDTWEQLSATKKGKILQLMLGKNADNIKDFFLLLETPFNQLSTKHQKDFLNVSSSIKNILG